MTCRAVIHGAMRYVSDNVEKQAARLHGETACKPKWQIGLKESQGVVTLALHEAVGQRQPYGMHCRRLYG